MSYLFTSESVSEGHPDKVADQISDALLDEFLRFDPNSKVACETLVTTGLTVCSGEVLTEGYVDLHKVVRKTIKEIGYTKNEYRFEGESCGIISTLHEQSADINRGVVRSDPENQGAGDQGMMFGYATRDMENYMPMPIELAHVLLQELAAIRKEGKKMTYLRPDAKSQVTIEYDDNNHPVRIDTIVISTQHDDFADKTLPEKEGDEKMRLAIENDIRNILLPRVISTLPDNIQKLFDGNFKLHVNPTGKFVIGGPHGDTGLTGRKIIVDTYGGKGAHGGGAFSGKDPSKVDRSAAYAARHIAKNLVAAGVADEVLVQLAYAIGIAEPVGVYVNTYGTCKVSDADGKPVPDGRVAEKVKKIFDLRPYSIINRFGLRNPIYTPTASYGHFGRDPRFDEVEVYYNNGETYNRTEDGVIRHFKKVKLFAWEETDYVEKIRTAFGL
ncbi:methionine adenosyltransferase [Lentimicrobium sp.]|jgi:S-adenosylmethionine synthetase|uniref:methionine adenosyltransferase n=1 Tax=Lentimicrobium sp. TaxID=2034841 RepID=UPI0025EAB8F6|nr:methionine adenosyltransferase [Lentimicrobium sp.]MCO5256844.1 methionine adenosyltransferase [Lentimicrobium sp.]MCO5263566.1 methionine adenosyltransferase [Lentimicrobium sp.]HOP14209.1 methionine adenosyltransferase [Lentimicrobium sp.]HPJ61389.1 methionine adenosyltransferase [Lentimicrobium sp.]HPR26195.1 methionine adenosyltransferase [Lentimicrobium sp.]